MSEIENKTLHSRIEAALNTIRPHLKVDGGDVEVVEITEDMIVKVKWLGTCESCSMSVMTMKAGIEQAVMSHVSEVKAVEAINGVNFDFK